MAAHWLAYLPKWLFVVLALLVIYLTALTTYAVLARGYSVEFWPPKLVAPGPAKPKVTDSYLFRIQSVDDQISCTLNGTHIASKTFGHAQVERDITSLVRPGKNVLFCRVIDDDNGQCYSYVYDLLKNGTEKVFEEKYSCCRNAACVKATPYVLEKDHVFEG